MKKWPIFMAAAAVVIVGCGGGGGKTVTAVTATAGNLTGSVSGDSVAFVNLPTTAALMSVYYNSGQGRAVGDITANMGSAQLINSSGFILQDPLPKAINLLLSGYTQQAQVLDQVGITNSAQYNTFVLNIPTLSVQNDPQGDFTTVFGPVVPGTNPPQHDFFLNASNGGSVANPGSSGSFAANLGLLPGRQTTLQVFLNDGSINVDQASGNYLFFRQVFLSNNTTASNPNVQGFLSDYIQFDISHVANPPQLLAQGTLTPTGPASMVYMGGEDTFYGASGATPGGPITVYRPTGALSGTFGNQQTLPPPPTGVAPVPTGGTYTIVAPDPRNLSNNTFITALQGIWRPFAGTTTAPTGGVIQGLGTFEVILMPHMADDNNQDMIVVVRDGALQSSHITNMYYGIADLASLTFTVFPIADLTDGSDAGAITGTLSQLVDGTGAATTVPQNVRSGRFTFPGSVPAGFRPNGRFIEYRV